MSWLEKLRKDPQPASIAAALSLLALTGVVDAYTGTTLSFDAFYLIPVLLIGWFAGSGAGVSISVAAGVVWFVADTRLRPESALEYAPYWNAFMRLVFFLTVTYLLPSLKAEIQRERESPSTDFLTKTSNRRSFLNQAEIEIQRSHRYKHPFTVVSLNIDNLRFVNNRVGHSAGDALLQGVAFILRERTRSTDLIGRMGGDEFALILPETQADAARIVVKRLQKYLVDLAEKNEWPISFSFGVATYVQPPENAQDMVRKAEALVAAAKQGGKNTFKHEIVGPVEVSD